MTTSELLQQMVGQNIDDLVNLDLRGYGISRILYAAAKERCGGPLSINGAMQLREKLKSGGTAFILTGFVFLPHEKGELDGLTGSVMLARAMVLAWGVKPVIICEEKIVPAVKNVLRAAGIQPYDSLDELERMPAAAAVMGVSTDPAVAERQTAALLAKKTPDYLLAIEKPGRNCKGVYHMGGGADVSHLAAKVDDLFMAYQKQSVPTLAVGDLGNEIGLGSIGQQIRSYIPLGAACGCPCGDGICVETCADHLVTASTSDWACYGLTAAMAFLEENTDLIPDRHLEKKVLECANQNDLIDGSGWAIPSIDGVGLHYNMDLVEMLRNCVAYPLKARIQYKTSFERVVQLGYYNHNMEE